jgi:CO dehydrogenase maturation factor
MCDTCGSHDEVVAPVLQPNVHSHSGGTRVVVVGKGGVGKSTLSAVLARQLARGGWRVVAVDADEQRNLAASLGMSLADSLSIVPVTEHAEYVHEKTGARPGQGAGGLLVLNPDTTDLIDRLSVQAPDGVRLVVMGGVREAGRGCLCPETALISSAVAGMHLYDEDVVVMDTHAGVEHFGRALARGFDSVVVVVEPTLNSVQVGVESAALAHELGIGTVHLVINRVRADSDLGRVLGYVDQLGAPHFNSVTQVPYDEMVLTSEPSVDALLEGSAMADAVGVLSSHVLASASRLSGMVNSCAPLS